VDDSVEEDCVVEAVVDEDSVEDSVDEEADEDAVVGVDSVDQNSYQNCMSKSWTVVL